jgi:hypothetical protein
MGPGRRLGTDRGRLLDPRLPLSAQTVVAVVDRSRAGGDRGWPDSVGVLPLPTGPSHRALPPSCTTSPPRSVHVSDARWRRTPGAEHRDHGLSGEIHAIVIALFDEFPLAS